MHSCPRWFDPATLATAALLALCSVPAHAADQDCSKAKPAVPGGCGGAGPGSTSAAPSAQQVLERMRAAYAALRSYTDTGTVLSEQQSIGAPPIVERHRFSTGYAAPRRFLFDFRKNDGAERFVIWCPGETFQSWWSATQVHEQYPRGEGATAFALGTLPTGGAALLIPALLFPGAGLLGPLVQMDDARYIGNDSLAGRVQHKLAGAVRVNHWAQATRLTTVWIDTQTHLVRKVVEDTPSGAGRGVVDRITTSFEPQADVPLGDASFRFSPPR